MGKDSVGSPSLSSCPIFRKLCSPPTIDNSWHRGFSVPCARHCLVMKLTASLEAASDVARNLSTALGTAVGAADNSGTTAVVSSGKSSSSYAAGRLSSGLGCQGRNESRPRRRSKSRPVDQGIVGEEGVWSGGLRRLKGGAFRPQRKTSSSPRRV